MTSGHRILYFLNQRCFRNFKIGLVMLDQELAEHFAGWESFELQDRENKVLAHKKLHETGGRRRVY